MSAPPQKKPRFDARNPSTLPADAPEDDVFLNLDEVGKGGTQTKRNAVKLDGYDSDSSEGNFDARADDKLRKKRAQKSKDEDDQDMFADLDEEKFGDGDDDEELAIEGKRKKLDVKFLEDNEIEGQVSSSKSGGHVATEAGADVESSSSSGDDEERDRIDSDIDEEVGAGGKKKHAPKLDAFNMKSENEEGRFDSSGNYVRKAVDPDAIHDSWLEGVSKKDVKRAKEAQEKRDEDIRKKNAEDDMVLTSDLLKALISQLKKGETAMEALKRLGKKKENQPKLQKNKRKGSQQTKDAMVIDSGASVDAAETTRKEAVAAITEAATQLFSRGESNIYDHEREWLVRQYTRETGEQWQEPQVSTNQTKQWEFRWSDARDGGEVHGPYDGSMMTQWSDAAFFSEGAEFREIGETAWSRSVDFV